MRLRRVMRGGVGSRKRSEEKGTRLRGVRRIRWNRMGPAMARAPRRKSGVRKLMTGSLLRERIGIGARVGNDPG